jgi:hypothetical protein
MSLSSVVVVPERRHFCELSLSLDRRDEKILSVTSRIKDTNWNIFQIGDSPLLIDKAFIPVNLELCVLESLRKDPMSTLSEQEERHLLTTKRFEKKTKFFLSVSGGVILTCAAMLSAAAGGLGYYYGVRQPAMDPADLAVLFAVATLVGAVASNLLGFYITGTLPHHASNADNTEQNIWEKFSVCKIKPAAYQLLHWFSPDIKLSESRDVFEARRSLALAYAFSLKLDDIVAEFKLFATQNEKIDVAFSHLYEAISLIKMQQAFESGQVGLNPICGELSFAAKMMGYFR